MGPWDVSTRRPSQRLSTFLRSGRARPGTGGSGIANRRSTGRPRSPQPGKTWSRRVQKAAGNTDLSLPSFSLKVFQISPGGGGAVSSAAAEVASDPLPGALGPGFCRPPSEKGVASVLEVSNRTAFPSAHRRPVSADAVIRGWPPLPTCFQDSVLQNLASWQHLDFPSCYPDLYNRDQHLIQYTHWHAMRISPSSTSATSAVV